MENSKIIAQFMWTYQRTFRSSARNGAESALELIGFRGRPDIWLIGFRVADDHAFDICIEPEDGPYSPNDLSDIPRRAEELYQQHPEHDRFYSAPHIHEKKHRELRRRMRGEALAEALAAAPAGHGRTFFANGSPRVGDYEVHILISVESDALAKVPRLETTQRDRAKIPPSLVHAVIDEILIRATRNLYLPDPGMELGVLGAGRSEIVRSATETFVRAILYCAGYLDGEEADLLLSGISALPYEGRAGTGRLIIAKPEDTAIDVVLKLQRPVNLRDTRAVRKLIEASGINADLLVGDGFVYGLGLLKPDYDESDETVFVVSVANRGTWELYHGDKSLLSVRDGVAGLPVHTLDIENFEDLVDRLLPGADKPTLTSLARAAGRHQHGAMLVVSSDAAAEAQRLSPQAWAVEPVPLDPDLLTQLTAMDGAVLVDSQGYCHAIGVILDGHAAGQGDPSRGSRYNNPVRYLDSESPPSVVVVYSTDRSTDILPQLRPRVYRNRVDSAVRRYLDLAAVRPPHLPHISEAWDAVKSLQFYLSEEQCAALNAARATIDEWRKENTMIRIIEADLLADPGMNASYWLD